MIFGDFSYALSHHCTVAWVTRHEHSKGVKDRSRPEGPKAGPKSRNLEVGPLDFYIVPVYWNNNRIQLGIIEQVEFFNLASPLLLLRLYCNSPFKVIHVQGK